MIPGVDRPAIISLLPSQKGDVRMLDLGANIDCNPQQLVQFAIMGAVLTEAITGKKRPTVGLLNVGAEEIKGNLLVKETSELLSQVKAINYVGYIEGNDIYQGTVDVVVCDGFVGNIVLKASEGIVRLLASQIKNAFNVNWFTKLCAIASLPVLKQVKKKLDPYLIWVLKNLQKKS
jgi:glycerol-3-phosphate acyltransferase PlsX